MLAGMLEKGEPQSFSGDFILNLMSLTQLKKNRKVELSETKRI